MAQGEQQKAAREFVAAWEGRGYEKGDAQVFWTELLQQVCGVRNISAQVKFEHRTSGGGFIDCLIPDAGVLVEQKGLGVDLDKPELRQGRMVTPLEQALSYAQSFKRDAQPRFVVTCNFERFRVYDRNLWPDSELAAHPVEFTLAELGESPHLLGFITDPANSRAEKERRASMEAGALIGKLHEALRARYIDPDSPESAHSLNVLCVRLVFCLFCEDAGLFPKDAMLGYLRKVPPENMWRALRELFAALATPLSERDPYDREKFAPFPYVNGGLFEGDVEIPNFTQDLKHLLLFEVSQQTDWSRISPTIFGGIFESTLNPETRRKGGMHYTAPENIHKVIDPLFLDELRGEFDAIRLDSSLTPRKRKNALARFHAKIADLQFLDPACGSGNFLTETYLSLRRLEDDVLNALNDGQTEISWGDGAAGVAAEGDAATLADSPRAPDTADRVPGRSRVTLAQLHGIEINDFACRVAQVALWIAQLQANQATDMLLDLDVEDFPLTDAAHIVQANALTTDWNDVLPAEQCDYVMGNPPFVGARNQSVEQKSELESAFHGAKNCGNVDYVAGWYMKAAEYMRVKGTEVLAGFGTCGEPACRGRVLRAAFVSTNSIVQGEQAANVFSPLYNLGTSIDFAWPTFVWNSEAEDKAHVHVVVIGFSTASSPDDAPPRHPDDAPFRHPEERSDEGSRSFLQRGDSSVASLPQNDGREKARNNGREKARHGGDEHPRLFDPATGEPREVAHINAYLAPAPDAFVWNRAKPLCNAPSIGIGNKPIDGGNYLFTEAEMRTFLADEPAAEPFFRPWMGSDEFIKGKRRFVLWLGEATPVQLKALPKCRERVLAVRDFRLASKSAPTRRLAERPTRFHVENMPTGSSILIPKVSSERRRYVPMGFIDPGTFCSDLVFLIPDASLYHFGVLHSRMHSAWMRRVCGRLESRYRYSGGVVYNNFVWPGAVDPDGTFDGQTPVGELVEPDVRERTERAAQAVLDARALYPGSTMADMYDPDNAWMFPELASAHAALDTCVEAAYGVDFAGDEEAIVAHLFHLYAQATSKAAQ